MPSDKYTKFILTVIACGLLAIFVQNAMGPSDPQVAPSETAPSQQLNVEQREIILVSPG